MRKVLLSAAVVCFLTGVFLPDSAAQNPPLSKFTPTETTYPVEPDEQSVLMRQQYGIYVYKLTTDNACRGIVLANLKTGYYQRLEDIGCEPDVDHVSFAPSELDGYISITFYTKTVIVGRMTIKEQE